MLLCHVARHATAIKIERVLFSCHVRRLAVVFCGVNLYPIKKMKDNPEFNVQFVSIVEKHPLIYDYNSNDYSNRNLQDKTWEKISKELNESGK